MFKGRVLKGGYTNGTLWLVSGDSEEIISDTVFGLGHVIVVVTVTDADGAILAEKSEDGLLLGGRILLYHPEE